MAESNRRNSKKPVNHTLLCDHTCPYWGKPHKNVWNVKCVCGAKAIACGYCLVAGRLTSCPKCAAEKN